MKKILIVVNNDTITFSLYKREVNEADINKTNVIDSNNLKFSEEYIKENIELIASFLNTIVLKKEVNKVVIKHLDIAPLILKVIKNINSLTNITFTENEKLSFLVSSLLLENTNFKKIECYTLPEVMFHSFPENVMHTRSEILFASNFMIYNHINTYSKIYNLDKISINDYFEDADYEDFEYLISQNRFLKKLEMKQYNEALLIKVLDLLKKNKLEKVTVIIYEPEDNIEKEVLKISKKYNNTIKIRSYDPNERAKILKYVIINNISLFVIVILLALMIITLIGELL